MLNDMNFNGTWRDYQARVLQEMDEHFGDGRLHVVAAPGAGKTVLGLEIVRRIGRPALVFAPTIAIREQWAHRLCPLFLDTPPEAATISRDLADFRDLTLATYQSLDSLRRGEELDALIETLNGRGPLTLVLDEAHHLRREWWKCLNALANRLVDVRLVALTATPPYDASFAEWSRYEELCGPIDLEIGIPELVRNGDLCPHQDHLILSEPTEDALALLARRREAIGRLHMELRANDGLLDWLAAHPWLTDSEAHVEEILEAPEMLSAVLVLLASAGRALPRPPLKLLGVSARNVPPPSLFWLERLLDGLVAQQTADFPLDPAWLKGLRDRLNRHGLIEGGRVRLHHTRSVFKLMTSSLAKLDSIVEIAEAEKQALAGDLRMVVLSDHIRAGDLPKGPDAQFKPAKLGVIPIFEKLRRSAIAEEHLGVLTGSIVILPKSVLAKLTDIANDLHVDPGDFRTSNLPGCPGHVRIECRTGGTAQLVRLVTALFTRGDVRILVGTQSLLGEGWDAPALNSLVLASNTASFMLSNQTRGRAIRIDPAKPAKVANIWHLATVDPEDRESWDAVVSAFNWGFLNDGGAPGLSDITVVARRFKAFEGISNGTSTLIEDGIARLGLDPSKPAASTNLRTFAIAADRHAIAGRWKASLGQGAARSQVRETAAPRYAPRALSWFDTIQALGWSAAGSGVFAAANELRGLASYAGIGAIAMGLAGAATLASLPRLARAGRLVWRNGSLEGSLEAVTGVVLQALVDAEVISARELSGAHVEIRTSLDGRKDIVLTGVSRATERQVMQAVAEILGPVQNPRYLLVRNSWLGLKRRVDYHAVPAALGARKEHAERFAELWRGGVGSSKLVFTRTADGRRTMLRARASSFAAGFQRVVDRRSVWL
ncbi:DEAD/DEAH box helicase family protein [Erythrobacter sp. JK5]|uniref:DEAD/DEAH box helicase family protein n=1 Tax=Erythrobacter sp. JK5 TaxID=2829500 RepID=UPI001BA5907C|nr:DEAD/DEAH box helicase family protein [Erythrobacter sp. JK5]QUL37181.1 DEAD/DEAH box helicase family protein [Erythrobacter sp. JK5]